MKRTDSSGKWAKDGKPRKLGCTGSQEDTQQSPWATRPSQKPRCLGHAGDRSCPSVQMSGSAQHLFGLILTLLSTASLPDGLTGTQLTLPWVVFFLLFVRLAPVHISQRHGHTPLTHQLLRGPWLQPGSALSHVVRPVGSPFVPCGGLEEEWWRQKHGLFVGLWEGAAPWFLELHMYLCETGGENGGRRWCQTPTPTAR